MVTGHKKGAVPRAQARQRRHMHRQIGHRAIHQIAGDGHHVSAQAIDGAHNAFQVSPLDGGPHMNITDLRHGKAPQCLRQAMDGHIDLHHRRRAPRIEKPQGRHQQRQAGHGLGGYRAELRHGQVQRPR